MALIEDNERQIVKDIIKKLKDDEIRKKLDNINTKKSDENKNKGKKEFKCPICNCSGYEACLITTGFETIGGHGYPSYYMCKGCSVLFKNPDKFTKSTVIKIQFRENLKVMQEEIKNE